MFAKAKNNSLLRFTESFSFQKNAAVFANSERIIYPVPFTLVNNVSWTATPLCSVSIYHVIGFQLSWLIRWNPLVHNFVTFHFSLNIHQCDLISSIVCFICPCIYILCMCLCSWSSAHEISSWLWRNHHVCFILIIFLSHLMTTSSM